MTDHSQEVMNYFTAAKTALDLIKGIFSTLPKSANSHEAQMQIEKAEAALKLSQAELAKSLGFTLCKCSFPPPIMLWNGTERTNICPACGDRDPPPNVTTYVPQHEASWIKARRGGR